MRLRSDEKLGLAAAVVLHGALGAVLLMQAVRSEVAVFPDRIAVSLATEVGLEAASPDPVSESRASIAPTLAPEAAPAPEQVRPDPRTAAAQPAASRDRSRPDRPTPNQTNKPTPPSKVGGGSRIGDDFLPGKGSSTTTQETRAPAPRIGAIELASLRSAIGRQVAAEFQGKVPTGPDVDKLVTRVRIKLNPDGTLAAEPQLLGETAGVTESNRFQVGRHREEAVRSIKRVGQFKIPFPVPPEQNTFTLVFDKDLR